jgi:zinc D-Ala-D-Ala dipeptidase
LRSLRYLAVPLLFALALLSEGSLLAGEKPSREPARTALEGRLLEAGFCDVQEKDPSLRVELKYASEKNFMGANLYGDFTRGYLREEAAEKLAAANRRLKEIEPGLTILLADGLRPRHVQEKMWEVVRGTPMQNYVADPRTGSMHNYGCAVDVTIIDAAGNRLDMGTPMDHFGILSEIRHEERFLREGKLTAEQVANRRLLRKVMVAAGFRPLPIEWWHFDAFEKDAVRKTYSIVE